MPGLAGARNSCVRLSQRPNDVSLFCRIVRRLNAEPHPLRTLLANLVLCHAAISAGPVVCAWDEPRAATARPGTGRPNKEHERGVLPTAHSQCLRATRR